LKWVDPLGRGRRIETLAITPAPLSARITIPSMIIRSIDVRRCFDPQKLASLWRA